MFTNLGTIIYLADVAEAIGELLLFMSIFGFLGLAIMLFTFFIEVNFHDSLKTFKNPKKSIIPLIAIWIFITFASILTPTKNAIYLLVGGVAMDKGLEDLSKSNYPKEMQRTLDNLLNKINKELESESEK